MFRCPSVAFPALTNTYFHHNQKYRCLDSLHTPLYTLTEDRCVLRGPATLTCVQVFGVLIPPMPHTGPSSEFLLLRSSQGSASKGCQDFKMPLHPSALVCTERVNTAGDSRPRREANNYRAQKEGDQQMFAETNEGPPLTRPPLHAWLPLVLAPYTLCSSLTLSCMGCACA